MTIIDQGNGAAGPAAADLIKDTTTQTFVKDVIEESKRQPVLIDFWAEWCGPCKAIAPVLDELGAELDGRMTIAKVNVDESPELAQEFGIRSIPTLLVFKNGEVADKMVGSLSKTQLQEKLNDHL